MITVAKRIKRNGATENHVKVSGGLKRAVQVSDKGRSGGNRGDGEPFENGTLVDDAEEICGSEEGVVFGHCASRHHDGR